jgi:peptide-methionine (S)-S-oxide reductase
MSFRFDRTRSRRTLSAPMVALLVLVAACGAGASGASQAAAGGFGHGPAGPPPEGMAVATFAGGCFWCMEPPFDKIDGVVSTTSGYTGGSEKNPTYEEVSSGTTGHAESMRIVYDPKKVSYEELLDVYWHNTDPTQANAQFCDHGTQYRPAIFYHDEEQRKEAEASKAAIAKSGVLPGPIVTQIVPAGDFWPAEEYHQDFYEKNPVRYKFYRTGCGRDARLKELWGDAAGGH